MKTAAFTLLVVLVQGTILAQAVDAAEVTSLKCVEVGLLGHLQSDEVSDIRLLPNKAMAFGKQFESIYPLPRGTMYESGTHMLSVEHDIASTVYYVHSYSYTDHQNNQLFECIIKE